MEMFEDERDEVETIPDSQVEPHFYSDIDMVSGVRKVSETYIKSMFTVPIIPKFSYSLTLSTYSFTETVFRRFSYYYICIILYSFKIL